MNLPSPDQSAADFLSVQPDPLRYDWHTNDPSEVAGMIAAQIPRNACVLDVGCGTGSLSKIIMESRSAQLTGIEPDTERATAAMKRGINVVAGFFDKQAIMNMEEFDAVVFADVLEHLPDPSVALGLAYKVLKPNGMVVASVPNIAHWTVRWNLLCGRFDYEACGIMDATHLRWFTESTIRVLFERNGYRVESHLVTAGLAMPVYSRFPWSFIRPRRLRAPLVRWLSRAMPRLFGCQHVIRAVKK